MESTKKIIHFVFCIWLAFVKVFILVFGTIPIALFCIGTKPDWFESYVDFMFFQSVFTHNVDNKPQKDKRTIT